MGHGWSGEVQRPSSSSSRSYLIVGSLQQTQFSSSQFCHGQENKILILTSSSVFSISLMSRLSQSIHLCFCLPPFILPGGTISRDFTCQNHLSLASLSSHPHFPFKFNVTEYFSTFITEYSTHYFGSYISVFLDYTLLNDPFFLINFKHYVLY